MDDFQFTLDHAIKWIGVPAVIVALWIGSFLFFDPAGHDMRSCLSPYTQSKLLHTILTDRINVTMTVTVDAIHDVHPADDGCLGIAETRLGPKTIWWRFEWLDHAKHTWHIDVEAH